MLKEGDIVTSFKIASTQPTAKLRRRHGQGDDTFHSCVCMF